MSDPTQRTIPDYDDEVTPDQIAALNQIVPDSEFSDYKEVPIQTTVDHNQYRCAACGGVFDRGWTEEEASAELDAAFPGFDKSECAIVCDDCYKEMGF